MVQARYWSQRTAVWALERPALVLALAAIAALGLALVLAEPALARRAFRGS